MEDYGIILIDQNNWNPGSTIIAKLIEAYAIRFWSANWKELLAVRDAQGRVIRQFGTCDKAGRIFPETLALLNRASLDARDPDWPERLWRLADQGALSTAEGDTLTPYWSLASAEQELASFVIGRDADGFAGEILLASQGSAVVGFTAYACAPGQTGRALAEKRFPSRQLHYPLDAPSPSELTVSRLLSRLFPDEHLNIGTFLDHAISEAYRGRRLGSRLFDLRLARMLELGADVIFGRTMLTEPRQYAGNYLARGLSPVAADGTDDFSRAKHYFVARRETIRPRGA